MASRFSVVYQRFMKYLLSKQDSLHGETVSRLMQDGSLLADFYDTRSKSHYNVPRTSIARTICAVAKVSIRHRSNQGIWFWYQLWNRWWRCRCSLNWSDAWMLSLFLLWLLVRSRRQIVLTVRFGEHGLPDDEWTYLTHWRYHHRWQDSMAVSMKELSVNNHSIAVVSSLAAILSSASRGAGTSGTWNSLAKNSIQIAYYPTILKKLIQKGS